MRTQLELAKKGIVTSEMNQIAKAEGINSRHLCERVASGELVVMTRLQCKPLGIGYGLRTKINANIGTSSDAIDIYAELQKAVIAEKYGADTISDLSMGGDINLIRRKIMEKSKLPITTVPIYQTIALRKSFRAVTESALLETIREHVDEGISSIVIHAGFTRKMLGVLKRKKRVMGMVSKGGSFTAVWMLEHKSENPFLENFDEILEMLHERDVVLSLGNTMRSGCVHDLKDAPQLEEIKLNKTLAKRANNAGVQVIIEGMGGHVNVADIERYVRYHKKVINNRPLFVAGPLPIEIAVGYDHIAACVGASLASGAGADYLCYITPSEHLGLPTPEQVREGVVAFKIAAHIGDSIKYGISKKDLELAKRRRVQDWAGQFKFAIDGERARELHPESQNSCTMCGKFCALKLMDKYLGVPKFNKTSHMAYR